MPTSNLRAARHAVAALQSVATAASAHRVAVHDVDAAIACSRCDAVCCGLVVVVQPEDGIAEHLTARHHGLRVMARDAEGWCVALDAARMCCAIYDARPAVCRRFRMGGPTCGAVREDYARHAYPPLDLLLTEDPP